MEAIEVHVPGNEASRYPVFIGSGVLQDLTQHLELSSYSKLFILTDRNVAAHWLQPLKEALKVPSATIIIASGEEHKNLSTLGEVWSGLAQGGADRKSLLINLGGGVVGDLGGFAAATYMRGISFIQIPTTLLAQVDASVGGKTAIDHGGVKNLVGSFAQPKAVFIDVVTLSTLRLRELTSGFAEMIKHGLIRDRSYFVRACSKSPSELSSSELRQLVTESVAIKAAIVEQDEKESGPRKLLNFGHTAGHAVEAVSHEVGLPLLHGEAVALGMLVEAQLSTTLGLITDEQFEAVRDGLTQVGLPTALPFRVSFERLLPLIASDKKNRSGRVYWTLLTGIGESTFDREATAAQIESAFSVIISNT